MARILIGNIKGPKGDQGPQGNQGPIGPTGPQGPLPPLINNALATEAGKAALDAVMGKTLGDKITQLNSDFHAALQGTVNLSYPYDGIKTTKTVYAEMATNSICMFEITGGQTITNELGYNTDGYFGALVILWKYSGWRGGGLAFPLGDWAKNPSIGVISKEVNNVIWFEAATKADLPNLETEWNVADSGIVLRCVSGDGSAIQLATTPDGIQLQKRSSSSGNWEVVWAK